ncbi:hypothetical protein EJ02DRAFT_148195 [Clathrospora elynae]|uniref:Uncharacterized protein n=1 Tax=Clathrospora elynae TaxID=706981 RepID=A0A6A5STE6_9PLEO|nr:hypothetical protein EJ02DRAFT_148195 [Clathrospora elynae]
MLCCRASGCCARSLTSNCYARARRPSQLQARMRRDTSSTSFQPGTRYFSEAISSKGSSRSGILGAEIKLERDGIELGTFALTAYSAISSSVLDTA